MLATSCRPRVLPTDVRDPAEWRFCSRPLGQGETETETDKGKGGQRVEIVQIMT